MITFNFNPFPVIETPRLRLRKIYGDDLPLLYDLRSNKEVMKYIGRPLATDISMAKALLKIMDDGIEKNESITWGITLKDKEKLIGTIGYHKIERENYRAEIGYLSNPVYWQQGIMSEAIEFIIAYGFKQMHLHSIEAKVNPENEHSMRLLEKFGFVKEAHFKENYFFEGRFSDTVVYSLLA